MNKLDLVENEHTPPLTEKGLFLRRGWNHDTARQLVHLSKEPLIKEFTPNDAGLRFTSTEKGMEWFDKHHRVVYTLADTAINGLIWFGETPDNPTGDFTFAIRMYQKAQGRGLATHFMNAAHTDFRETEQYEGPIWLETDAKNERARALYLKTGYEEISSMYDRIMMVYKHDAEKTVLDT